MLAVEHCHLGVEAVIATPYAAGLSALVDDEAEIVPAVKRAFARGGTSVIHVCIDPKANSEEMPNYAEFRTWYAEGTQ